MAIKAELTLMKGHDLKAYVENIDSLEKSMRKDIMSKAVRAWTQPVAKAIRERAPVGDPEKTDNPGQLKKSISRRHRSYKKGEVHVGMAGPAATGSKTAPHWHLMEFGTVDRWHKRKSTGFIEGFAKRDRRRARRNAMRRARRHLGLSPKPARRAMHAGAIAARDAMKISRALDRTLAFRMINLLPEVPGPNDSLLGPFQRIGTRAFNFGRMAVNRARGRGRFTGRVPKDTFAFIRPGFIASQDEANNRMAAKATERVKVALRTLPNKA